MGNAMKKLYIKICTAFLVASLTFSTSVFANAAQGSDKNFKPVVKTPAYPLDQGLVVKVDAGHNNFHTIDKRYRAFAELLRMDGYRVESINSEFDAQSLAGVDILVIANPLHESNADDKNWKLPTPSAYTPAEIDTLVTWVKQGGALMIAADHMPFPGATNDLVQKFGFSSGNGYAFSFYFLMTALSNPSKNIINFSIADAGFADGSLKPHQITRGRNSAESVPFVHSFTGHAFKALPGFPVKPLMVLGFGSIQMSPEVAEGFSFGTPIDRTANWLQGATIELGKGRVAMFGEAAMFSAQIAKSGMKMGMNNPVAEHNVQFALNVFHWLSGLLNDEEQ